MPTYLVTGANRGLGFEFIRQLAADSSNTIFACVRSQFVNLSDLEKISSKQIHTLVCDTGSIDSIRNLPSQVLKTLASGQKLDYVINNAAINSVPEQTSLSLEPKDLEEQMRVNVIGPAKTTQFLLENELLSPAVRIVNMTSGLGSMSVSLSITPRKCAAYSISKSAVNALTVQQSGEVREKLGEAIVVCVDPGWVKTRMGGDGAVLEPEESVGGMLKCIHGLEDGSNGKFYTYTGEEVPW